MCDTVIPIWNILKVEPAQDAKVAFNKKLKRTLSEKQGTF